MKKLITSAVAALALLFGFASCSGDLHDKPVLGDILEEAGIVGSINDWKAAKMTKVDESTYTYTFVATEETAQFSVQEEFGKWSSRWCGNNSAGVPEAAETTKIKPDCDLQKMVYSTEADPTHVQISGLSINSEYRITVKIEEPSTKILSCKIELTKGGEKPAEPAPTPYYFDGLYLVGSCFKIGDMTNLWSFGSANLIYGASVDKKTGNVTYTKDIVAVAPEGEMGINDASWNNKQKGSGVTIAAGADYVELNGDAGNFKVSGLKVDSAYRVYIQTTPEKVVSVKIEEICSYTLTFEITGLEEGNAAWINGQFWGSTWPNGWPMAEWKNEPNATLKANIPVAGVDGVATFNEKWNVVSVAKPGEKLSWEFKPVAADSLENFTAEANLVLKPADNLTCEIESVESGTYKISIDAGTEKVTVTKQ